MASGTLILRPSDDLNIAHARKDYNSPAYIAINEEVADDDSTYIYDSISVGSSTYPANSRFAMHGDVPDSLARISGGRIYIRSNLSRGNGYNSGGSTGNITLSVNDNAPFGGSFSFSEGWNTQTMTLSEDQVAEINDEISKTGTFPDITLNLMTQISAYRDYPASGKSYIYITQVYVELDYYSYLDIHKKENGIWYAAVSAFKKIDNAWQQMTEDECKNYLSSKYITNKRLFKMSVLTPPTKTDYRPGEIFDPTGMVVSVTYSTGNSKIIDNYEIINGDKLSHEMRTVTLSYTEDNVTVTTTFDIFYMADFSIALVDFDYTDNGNDTATITGWKGTLNGVESTELIIPNDPRIIL